MNDDTEDPKPKAEPVLNPVEVVMARIEAHEAEGEAIDKELKDLGLTRKKVNSIKAAKARLAREQALVAELTGAKG